ncbi:MAG: hypothetical protein L3J21_03620 [Devosiaceae bacterium]|nr:hypothetical protein [Devosiaceae bacterium]
MKKIATTSLTVLALVLASTATGQAHSLDDLLTDSQINEFCVDKTSNARVPVQFTDASGNVIEGTIKCEYASDNRRNDNRDRYDDDRNDDDRYDGDHDDDRYESRDDRS